MSNFDAELVKLYSVQAQIKEDPYLHAHSRNLAVIRRQASIFERCQEFLKDARTVLDWECRHGADACLVRMRRGPAGNLYGCDLDSGEKHTHFHLARLSG